MVGTLREQRLDGWKKPDEVLEGRGANMGTKSF
jgi:hypothetical protein